MKAIFMFFRRVWLAWQTFITSKSGSTVYWLGDSWVNLTVFNVAPMDMYDWARRMGMRAVDAGVPGYTAADELQYGMHRTIARWTQHLPPYFILSFGGNDILSHSADLLLYEPTRAIGDTMIDLTRLVNRICHIPGAKLLIHGYDYAHAESNTLGWKGSLSQKFSTVGLSDSEINALVKKVLDEFNRRLRAMADVYPGQVRYVDLRGTLSDGERWVEDIHPSSEGYRKLAEVLVREAKEFFAER